MATRTRTKGARIPATGFSAITGSSSITISGTFQSPKNGANYTGGTYPLSNGYGSYSDNRASITDETGSPGSIHSCTNNQTLVPPVELPRVTFRQRNPNSPFGVAETTLSSSVLPYYLEQAVLYPHVSTPDGSSIALARVPSVSEELLSGLNSLYELKDCQTLLKLIPVHFLWAAARGKRLESKRALHRWLRDIEHTTKSPLGALQVMTGMDLVWKFGIKPLVEDINRVQTQYEALDAKIQKLLNQKFSVRGAYTHRASAGQVHVSGNSNDTLGMYSQNISTYRTTVKTWVYGTEKYIDKSKLPSIDSLRLRNSLETLGLTPDATDAWEVIPYSFVVDWFLPIQTTLEQFGQAKPDPSWLLTSGSWSSVKTTTEGYTRWDVSPISGSNCKVEGLSGGNQIVPWSRKAYQRTALTTLPTGTPTIYIPRVQWPSFDQSITGIEMLLQRIKRTLK